jgi:hypothetical protein
LDDFSLASIGVGAAIGGILGAIEGGIAGGWKGALAGFAIGALIGAAFAYALPVAGGATAISAGGAGAGGVSAGALGLGVGIPVGVTAVAGSLGLLQLIQAAAGVKVAVTTDNARERYAAIFGLLVATAANASDIISSVRGAFRVFGAASATDEAVAQLAANATQTNINLGGTPLDGSAPGAIQVQGPVPATLINTSGMDIVSSESFIKTGVSDGNLVNVILGDAYNLRVQLPALGEYPVDAARSADLTQFNLDDTLAEVVQYGNNRSKIFRFFMFDGNELQVVKEFVPGDPLPLHPPDSGDYASGLGGYTGEGNGSFSGGGGE